MFWPAARRQDSVWVYNGCLVGRPIDAARALRDLLGGLVVGTDSLQAILDGSDLGGDLPGRPWTCCGYGLGLMTGRMGAAGRAMGHSGGRPGCVNAVHHFLDRADPVTLAMFTEGDEVGAVKRDAMRIALRSADR